MQHLCLKMCFSFASRPRARRSVGAGRVLRFAAKRKDASVSSRPPLSSLSSRPPLSSLSSLSSRSPLSSLSSLPSSPLPFSFFSSPFSSSIPPSSTSLSFSPLSSPFLSSPLFSSPRSFQLHPPPCSPSPPAASASSRSFSLKTTTSSTTARSDAPPHPKSAPAKPTPQCIVQMPRFESTDALMQETKRLEEIVKAEVKHIEALMEEKKREGVEAVESEHDLCALSGVESADVLLRLDRIHAATCTRPSVFISTYHPSMQWCAAAHKVTNSMDMLKAGFERNRRIALRWAMQSSEEWNEEQKFVAQQLEHKDRSSGLNNLTGPKGPKCLKDWKDLLVGLMWPWFVGWKAERRFKRRVHAFYDSAPMVDIPHRAYEELSQNTKDTCIVSTVAGVESGCAPMYRMPCTLAASMDVLACVSDPKVRRRVAHVRAEVTRAALGPSLQKLVDSRRQVARYAGCSSYASQQLATVGATVGSAEEACAFLDSFADAMREEARACVDTLHAMKRQDIADGVVDAGEEGEGDESVFYRSDRTYYLLRWQESNETYKRLHNNVSYRKVLSALNDICEEWLECRFEVTPVHPEEGWGRYMERVEVYGKESNRCFGLAYLDMDAPGKVTASFPITQPAIGEHLNDICDGMSRHALLFSFACAVRGDPIKARAEEWTGPLPDWFLSWEEGRTLFHEFGHLMASLHSRTQLQALAGNSGPTDYVEIAAALWERFYDTPATVQAIMDCGDESVSLEEATEFLSAASKFRALKQYEATLHSIYDQHAHGEQQVNVDELSAWVYGKYDVFAQQREGEFCLYERFDGLADMPGTYYSYEYSQAVAANILEHLQTVGRSAGQEEAVRLLRDCFLRFGSARPYSSVLDSLLEGSGIAHHADTSNAQKGVRFSTGSAPSPGMDEDCGARGEAGQ
eukprot:TRINITY_DN961_c1_g2_i3.p1 TRINITY_DN961_c1_g2~~TRINITY_DN961_c1_g2_i3.p1  ORF type:complete len:913 (-),score=172.10 TRINITY_DN961_c1_g2_i3:266-3004(-)